MIPWPWALGIVLIVVALSAPVLLVLGAAIEHRRLTGKPRRRQQR